MGRTFTAPNVISGTHGYIIWDGDYVYEASSFEAKIKTNRETLTFSGEMWEDSKLMSIGGEFTIKIRKVFSRAKALGEAFSKGEDPRSEIVGTIKDPDGLGMEKVTFKNCWFNDPTIMTFENGKIVEEEYSGGFTGIKFHDSINKK